MRFSPKKLLLMTGLAAMALSFAACGKKEAKTASDASESTVAGSADSNLPKEPKSYVTILDTMISDEERQDVAATIAQLMDMLTDRQREAIYLRYMHGMSYEEIAELMDLQVGSVRKLVYRAITVLREKSGQLRNPLLSVLAAWWSIIR